MPRPIALAAGLTAVAVLLWTAACTPAEDSASDSATSTSGMDAGDAAAVRITAPADGDTVSLPFTLQLEAQGVEVVAANATSEPGKGHHHLIIDGDEPADSLPLMPAPVVIHMGNGATERVLDSLAPGPHRIVAIFADGMHVPMRNVKRDTITIIVR